jgi:hypothetical protein
MPWENVARCDVCNVIKGDANRWLMATSSTSLSPAVLKGFYIFHWDGTVAHQPDVKLLCGEQCLQKLLTKFLEGR